MSVKFFTTKSFIQKVDLAQLSDSFFSKAFEGKIA